MTSGPLPQFSPLSFAVPPGCGGMRLDAFLGSVLPGTGLRARRRLWEHCRISVNGRPRQPGFAVSEGDAVMVEGLFERGSGPPAAAIGLAASGPDYLAFIKPCGLHSAHVAGSPEPSLEDLLPDGLILLTRLDKGTSGLVLAARTRKAATRFRKLEEGGGVEKRYLAIVRGRMEHAIMAKGRLAVANTAITKVLEEADPDPARHSLAEPLDLPAALSGQPGPYPDGDRTLVRVTIRRGARHQIRAHLAHAGHPVLGENLYAELPPGLEPGCLYLHHEQVAFAGFSAACPAPWMPCVRPLRPPL